MRSLLVRPMFSQTVENVLPFGGGIFRPELLETPLHVDTMKCVLWSQSFQVLFLLPVQYRQEVLELWNAEDIPLKHRDMYCIRCCRQRHVCSTLHQYASQHLCISPDVEWELTILATGNSTTDKPYSQNLSCFLIENHFYMSNLSIFRKITKRTSLTIMSPVSFSCKTNLFRSSPQDPSWLVQYKQRTSGSS